MVPQNHKFKKTWKAGLNRTNQKTGKAKETAARVFVVVLFAAFALFLAVSNIKIKAQRQQIEEKIAQISGRIETLKEEKALFEAKISGKSDPAYLEKEAREKFNLKKPGEQVAIIINSQEQTDKTPQSQESGVVNWPQNLLYKIRKFLGI